MTVVVEALAEAASGPGVIMGHFGGHGLMVPGVAVVAVVVVAVRGTDAVFVLRVVVSRVGGRRRIRSC